ncbi:Major facilitator superfamily domain general substrate transporter [Penicillium taxi]|uniref:Major facilitator superfamily domain general substrate transporter n=1 Tax=Penicillium taxi TaxID=168475 RepID=UPI002545ABE3|nr:Major facilitator superfamily domain general substrate transporter [Penicillium taxi]KAJ5887578.1 Major facilitator superfamily domain general substrate transporter [Penicillium taxi]
MGSFELQHTSSRSSGHDQMASKADIDLVERAEAAGQAVTYEESVAARLPKAHQEYLIERHGTLELDPIPSMSPADPYNWPESKKMVNLLLVAFHACIATFTAAGIIPAYADIAADLGVTLQQASYLTSLQIAIIGGSPLFWKPLSNRFGRRPIFLISLIGSFAFNIGCAKSTTYASLAACRALVAFFISPASAIGSAVVVETTFKKDRARYMGIWTLMVTLGVPIGPFIFGFVTYRVGYEWIFWILAITNGVQFILYLFLGPETRYIGSGVNQVEADWKTQYFSVRRIDPTPLTWFEFIQPLTLARHLSVLIPAWTHAMVFLFTNIMSTVEVPQLLQEKFELNSEQLGMQFIGIVIGSFIGEQMGGFMSDQWMSRRARRINGKAEPEFRLWLSYFGFLVALVGIIVFLVCTQTSAAGHWNVSPIIGTALGAVGNQLITTVTMTYAVDCYPQEAGSVGVFIGLVRQIWGFIGPFWFPYMFDSVGIAASSGICCAMIIAVSVIPTIYLHWRSGANRRREGVEGSL